MAPREIEDIDALISEAGGVASLYGHSSGGPSPWRPQLLLANASRSSPCTRHRTTTTPRPGELGASNINNCPQPWPPGVEAMPWPFSCAMSGSQQPRSRGCDRRRFGRSLKAVAPTLAYDHTHILGRDASVSIAPAASISTSTLVMHGDASFPFMGETVWTLSHAIPEAQLRIPGSSDTRGGLSRCGPCTDRFPSRVLS